MLLPSALGFSPRPPVSVYGTGAVRAIAAFLGTPSPRFATLVRSASRAWIPQEGFPSCLLARLPRSFRSRAAAWECVPAVLTHGGTGFSASCPSATPFGLALGPDLPRADQLYPGNLGHSAGRIPTFLSLLIPAFSLHVPPRPLAGAASPKRQCSPTNHLSDSLASASGFSPGHFRRGTSRPVSYYALFERVAASEPTSWLSSKSHILFHLTCTLGP